MKNYYINILIIGNINDPHIIRFIKHSKEKSSILKFSIISYVNTNQNSNELLNLFERVYFRKKFLPPWAYKIPKMQNFFAALDFKQTILHEINEKFDFVNVHYVSFDNIFCSKLYKEIGNFLVLSPYGSDVLRAPSIHSRLLQKLFKKSDFISTPISGFRDFIIEKFNIPESKLLNLGFGSEIIDILEANQDLTRESAKRLLGFEDKTIITIGYNGSVAQNHLKIIQQIGEIKHLLTKEIILIFPMTYPSNIANYINEVRIAAEKLQINFNIYDSFLSNEELLYLRKSSDIFIHGQNTDASSASLQEYLLTDTNVLNAAWLNYPQFEKYGKPYIEFNSFDEIGSILLKVIECPVRTTISDALKIELYKNGWRKKILPWIDFFENHKTAKKTSSNINS